MKKGDNQIGDWRYSNPFGWATGSSFNYDHSIYKMNDIEGKPTYRFFKEKKVDKKSDKKLTWISKDKTIAIDIKEIIDYSYDLTQNHLGSTWHSMINESYLTLVGQPKVTLTLKNRTTIVLVGSVADDFRRVSKKVVDNIAANNHQPNYTIPPTPNAVTPPQ